MSEYNPLAHSVVQAMHGGYGQYEMQDFHIALFLYVQRELERVYWNVHQKEWHQYCIWELPGIEMRGYITTCECPNEWDDIHIEDCSLRLPHFVFEGVEVRWYKHIGRGMSVNREMTDSEWRAWMERLLTVIRSVDTQYY